MFKRNKKYGNLIKNIVLLFGFEYGMFFDLETTKINATDMGDAGTHISGTLYDGRQTLKTEIGRV